MSEQTTELKSVEFGTYQTGSRVYPTIAFGPRDLGGRRLCFGANKAKMLLDAVAANGWPQVKKAIEAIAK